MKKVVVVDDEANLRLLVAATLDGQGYTVLPARNGWEGLRVVREQRPDLVLLDVMMPGLDGLAVCRAIKGDPELAQTIVVLLTARGHQFDDYGPAAGLAAGAAAYLTKPFRPQELLALIARLVSEGGPPNGPVEAGARG